MNVSIDDSPTKIETIEIELPTSPISPRKKPRTVFQRYLQKTVKVSDEPEKLEPPKVKRGRPFVRDVESRDIKLTNYGKAWAKRNGEPNQDSGVSSNSSNCDEEDVKLVANRVERIMERQHKTLEREK